MDFKGLIEVRGDIQKLRESYQKQFLKTYLEGLLEIFKEKPEQII